MYQSQFPKLAKESIIINISHFHVKKLKTFHLRLIDLADFANTLYFTLKYHIVLIEITMYG